MAVEPLPQDAAFDLAVRILIGALDRGDDDAAIVAQIERLRRQVQGGKQVVNLRFARADRPGAALRDKVGRGCRLWNGRALRIVAA